MLYECHDRSTQLVLVDSGAGGTVIANATLFHTINPATRDECIKFGTGPRIPVAGRGTVTIHAKSMHTGEIHPVYVKGAYYVPTQPLNILSVGDVFNMGGAAIFDSRNAPCRVRWPSANGDVYQSMEWRRRLPYIINADSSVPVCMIRRVLPPELGYELTHATFGHMGLAKLKHLAAAGYVDESKLRSSDFYACGACEEANAKLESYPSRHDLAATHVNHTLHADLLHFPVVTLDGIRYLLVCLDEFTRFATVALLAKKSDAATHLLRIMKRARVLQDVRIKNLRTDCGGEFQNTVMRLAKEELGIADEYVPAHCHQSNGLIERLNYSLACIIRAVIAAANLPPEMWGEAALYAVHIYNLTPHTALLERKAESVIPYELFMHECAERMQRLYQQLVPFGICCSIVQTGDKPTQVKKLDARSIPGMILGMGPSTKQYRVMVLNHTSPYKVYIVRHVIVNAQHYKEYFSRSEMLPELRRYVPVRTVTILNPVRMLELTAPVPLHATDVPFEVPDNNSIPAHALSRGNACAEQVIVPDEGITLDEEKAHRAQEAYEANEKFDLGIDFTKTIAECEPAQPALNLTLNDYKNLCDVRRQWLSTAKELKVSPQLNTVQVNVILNEVAEIDTDAGSLQQLVVELYHLEDVDLWAVDLDNPTFSQAMSGPHREQWIEALTKEVESLNELDVKELVERPCDSNVMKGKVVCKIKRDALGHIERFKCRYVGCGYSQREGIDYFEHQVWAPTGQHATLKVLIVHAVLHDLDLRHIDISTAFLHGELNERVYVEQPPMLNDGTDKVWLLKKSLYGLKQAGRQWHIKLCETLKEMGFERAGYDPALFVRASDSGERLFIFLWVDDLVIIGSTESCNEIADSVLRSFKGRDLGEASWLLGMSITRDRKRKTVELSQERMIENCVERFNVKKGVVSVPISDEACPDPHVKARARTEKQLAATDDREECDKLNEKLQSFDKDAAPLSAAEHTEYMSIVGTVQYIAVVTRPDIAYAASSLARYMSCPTSHLLTCARNLLRYLRTTSALVLQYDCSKQEGTDVKGYSDADFAGCSKTSKSTSGIVILYLGQPVYWRSKRQPIVTSSTTEAELVALNLCALQVQWLKLLLGNDLGTEPLRADLLCDNQSTVTVAHNPVASDRTRHINVKHRKVQELIANQVLSVKWVSTKEQMADVFTKAMPRTQFEHLRTLLHVLPKLS